MATILIVDDDPNVRELLAEFVRTLGHKPVNASTGYEGIELFRANHPDLLILDYQMPVGTGADTLSAVRGFVGGEALPVIFVTGSPLAAVKAHVADPRVRFLSKPVELNSLKAAIDTLLKPGQTPPGPGRP